MKPLIGITCNYDPRAEVIGVEGLALPGQDFEFVAADYVYAIEEAGGIPVIIPYERSLENVERLISLLDGVLITGGHDIDPGRYGETATEDCGYIVPERDNYDLAVFNYAYTHDIPILGICRGCQIMNLAMGGDMYQDLEAEFGIIHCPDTGLERKCAVHETRYDEGSILYGIFGEKTGTNSFHHQGIKDPGKNVTITAHSDDGAVEGIEISGGPAFAVGVQWHPEVMVDSPEQRKLISTFVSACQ